MKKNVQSSKYEIQKLRFYAVKLTCPFYDSGYVQNCRLLKENELFLCPSVHTQFVLN